MVLHIACLCDELLGVFRSKDPWGPVLSARAVHDEHVGREVRNGRVERLRRAAIAGFVARGWSMACFLSFV